jgi:hypothetical protein
MTSYTVHDIEANVPRLVTVGLPAISAKGLGNRRLNKARRALLAADVISGRVSLEKLTLRSAATAFGYSVAYVAAALKITPAERVAIERGQRPLIKPTAAEPPLLTVSDWSKLDDVELVSAVRSIGVDRVIGAAVVAERAAEITVTL